VVVLQVTGTENIAVDPATVLSAVVVLVVAYALARTLSVGLSAVADRVANHRFRVTVLIPLLKFAVYGTALYLVVTALFDLTTTQLVAFSGLLGAAIGLGLKDLLADLVGGLILVIEQPYQVGDKVDIDNHYGEITDIGLRSTTLVTPNDTAVVVPNFSVLNDAVANANTSDAEMLVVVEFYIDVDANTGRARDIVEDALASSPYVLVSQEHPYTVRVADNQYYRTLTGKAYVNDLRNEQAFKSDVTERVLEAFAAEGIESPKVPAGGSQKMGE
jgi:small-conductance mechanosensitive channel